MPHTTVDIPTKFHEVWWMESKNVLNPPLFCFHGNCGKVCPTDSDFFGLSRSTRCGCCSYQVSSISVITLIYYNHAQCHCWWNFFPRGHCNLLASLKHLWITKLRSSVILLLPLFAITMPNATAGGIFFPRGHCNLVALLKHLWITKLRSSVILLLTLFTITIPMSLLVEIFSPRSLQLGSFT